MRGIKRIADVNLNRACEGLRVLEDIARFACNCRTLTGKFKGQRHLIRELFAGDIAGSTRARDIRGDVGSAPSVAEEKRRDILSLATTNAKRVEEALRSLEEVSKVYALGRARRIKRIRFQVYELEQQLQERLSRGKGLPGDGIYVVLPDSSARKITQLVTRLAGAPVAAIQLRCKSLSDARLLRLSKRIRSVTRKQGVHFIVNDRVDIALSAEADGVHIGQDDMPVEEIRKITDFSFTIGVSTHSISEALRAERDGADYLAFGSIFPTSSKDTAVIQGTGKLKRLSARVRIPVVAIGGITTRNAASVAAAGADFVAVLSCVAGAEDPKSAVKRLYRAFRKGMKNRTR